MIPQTKSVKQLGLLEILRDCQEKKKRKYDLARRTNTDDHWRAYYNQKKEVQRLYHASHNNYVSSLLGTHNKCTKKFWRYIKSMRKDQVSINALQMNGESYSDSCSKANILNDHFSSVFTEDDQSPLPDISNKPVPNISQISVEVDGVRNHLVNLDPYKAAGPDNIPTRLLKEIAQQMAPLLTFIFQGSLDQGKLPSDWKSANITPIHKKGKRTHPSNYRPISLTSVCHKTLEHVVYSSIFSHLENHQILTDNQHGFHTRRSCETRTY